MTRQNSLRDYDGDPYIRILCHDWIEHPVYRDTKIGTRATILNRPETCAFILARRHDEPGRDGRNKTWNEKHGGYAISEDALRAFRRNRIHSIVFGVTDEEVAHEFTYQQYDKGIPFEERDGDPQRAVGPPDEYALRTFRHPNVSVIDIDRELKSLADLHLKGAGTRRHEDDQ